MHRLLVYADKLPVNHNLVKLRFYCRDELVQNIAEREVGAVALEKCAANLRESGAVKNQLTSKHADSVGDVALLNNGGRCRCRRCQWCLNIPHLRRRRFEKGCSAGRTARRCTCPTRRSENPRALQVWIDPFKICPRVDLRQGLRTDLNDHASGAFDFLFRVQKSRVALQRGHDCLVQSKGGDPTDRSCFAAVCSLTAGKTRPTENAERYKNPQGKKEFSHRRLAVRCAKADVRIQRSLIAPPPNKWKSFRLAVTVNFTVN